MKKTIKKNVPCGTIEEPIFLGSFFQKFYKIVNELQKRNIRKPNQSNQCKLFDM